MSGADLLCLRHPCLFEFAGQAYYPSGSSIYLNRFISDGTDKKSVFDVLTRPDFHYSTDQLSSAKLAPGNTSRTKLFLL